MISQNNLQLKAHHLIFFISIMGISAIITGLYLLGNSFNNRLYSNTYINGIDVSGQTLSQALVILEKNKYELLEHEIILSVDDISISSSSSQLGEYIDYSKTIEETYFSQHKENSFKTALKALLSYFKKTEVNANTIYNQDKLMLFIEELNKKVELVGENPNVKLTYQNSPSSLVIFEGKPGRTIQSNETASKIIEELKNNSHNVEALVASTSSVLSKEEITTQINRATLFVGEKLILKADDRKFYLTDQDLVSIINPTGGHNINKIEEFIKNWEKEVNSQPQNAIFEYDKDTLEVKKFLPNRDGITINKETSVSVITNWLKKFENGEFKADTTQTFEIELPLLRTSPEINLEQTNNLGIKEKIGFGESYYHHSIPNRVHNVGITAERISYTIVPPKNEFSFNKTLGEISSKTGYKSAYVISGGKTILGDGGGVCQVSSTLFRSVLDAGLDVTKRLQHSYRVSYYELNSDPGFDATVYAGEVDFRFINDTDNYIIILTNVDEDNRYMNIEIYGTDDGRTAEIYDYKKWGQVGPPATEYYPTNELPTGVKKQIDWSVSGIKTEFKHTVKDKDGKIIHDDIYYSNYRPWSAKYMVGI